MQNQEFCFCALSLGATYRKLAVDLADNLKKVAPGTKLVLVTDKAQEFDGIDSIIALQHHHTFGYRPYNDKIFAIEAALQRFPIAFQMDVDATFNQNIETQLSVNWQPGISARFEPMLTRSRSRKKTWEKIKYCSRHRTVGRRSFICRARRWRKRTGFFKMLARFGALLGYSQIRC
jgi:hypothetical protein